DLIWNLGLDELSKQGQRFLPAEIASLGWDDGRHAFLNNAQLRADGYSLEANRRLHFPRQIRVVELVRIADALVRRQLAIGPAKRVALAGAEVGERHPMGTADPGVQLLNLGRKAVRRKPFDHRVRIKERAVDPLRWCTQHAVKPDGAGGCSRC